MRNTTLFCTLASAFALGGSAHALTLSSPAFENGAIIPNALFGLFSDLIKKAVREHLDGMAWPEKVGPPIAARLKRRAELLKLVEALRAEQTELKEALRQQGIILEDVPTEEVAP